MGGGLVCFCLCECSVLGELGVWRGLGRGHSLWALPHLYPSNWNARPEGCEQTWIHQLGDLFGMIRTMMDVRLEYELVCPAWFGVQQQPAKWQQNPKQVDILLWLLLRFGADMVGRPGALHLFHFCFSHTHLSLVFGLPGLARRQLAWPGDKAVGACLCKSCTHRIYSACHTVKQAEIQGNPAVLLTTLTSEVNSSEALLWSLSSPGEHVGQRTARNRCCLLHKYFSYWCKYAMSKWQGFAGHIWIHCGAEVGILEQIINKTF